MASKFGIWDQGKRTIACKLVEAPSNVTSISLPPTSRFSSWRG